MRIVTEVGSGTDDDAKATSARGTHVDAAAFDQLYTCYRPRLYAYLRSRTATDDDAADLTQQVFLQALAALPRSRNEHATFAAWLFRIARNAAVDFHRRQHRATTTRSLLQRALRPATQQDELTSRLIYQESLARLRVQYAALDPDSRELLRLRFAAQLTAPEIAHVLGVREAAVRKRLTRLLQRLKERYDEPARCTLS
jgi:RNA polymerase sigma-70 factor (ECF subfamily)